MAPRNMTRLAFLGCLTIAFLVGDLVSAEKEHAVDFRRNKWKTIHLKDAKKADVHFKTLKSLNCEVKKEVHNGHVDISFRLTKWRTASFKTHDEAHQWQDYFKGMGFETRHTH